MIFGMKAEYREFSGRTNFCVMLLAILDRTEPGTTFMTEILKGLHSMLSTSLIMCVADFVAEYNPFHGTGLDNNSEKKASIMIFS